MKLLIATGNQHKLSEIRAILQVPHLTLLGLKDLPAMPPVEEDGATFEANAIKKATTLARLTRLWTLADDSGLEVDALGGEPGVWSARYAGLPSNDAANNRKLLAKLDGVIARDARFRCVIALSDPVGACRTVAGACEGAILQAGRGVNGFGYDPLFVPSGQALTFAELDSAVKNRISHRAQALARAVAEWSAWLATEPRQWPK